MAAIGERVAVDDSPAVLVVEGREAIIANAGAASVFLGGEDVTATDGYELATNEQIVVDASLDGVYAICAAAATATLHVLAVRKRV